MLWKLCNFSCHIQAKNKVTHKSIMRAHIGIINHFGVHKTNLPQPTQISQKQVEEIIKFHVSFLKMVGVNYASANITSRIRLRREVGSCTRKS